MKRTLLINFICSFIVILALMVGILFVVTFSGNAGKPRLVISSESASAEYNGKPLTNSKWHLVNGELESGHRLWVEVSGMQTEVGISENTVFAKVIDESGKDVSKQYNIEYQTGTLNVKTRGITITAGSATKAYDGYPLTSDEYTISSGMELISGHQIYVTTEGSITDPGQAENIITSVVIINSSGEDVTRNYKITTRNGVLLVGDGMSGNGSGSGQDLANGLGMSGMLGGGGNNSDQVIFTVLAEHNGTLYLKIQSFGDYDKTTGSFVTAPVYGTYLKGNASAYYLVPSALDNSGLITKSATITPMAGIFALPYYADGSNLVQTSDTVISGDATAAYTVDYYFWQSVSGAAMPSKYAAYEEGYRAFVYNNYLSIDAETDTFMKSIISDKGFSSADPEIIYKVANYIKSAAEYNLNYDTKLDKSSNAVIAFLRDYKEGVCRHYAASATMLFRSLGIPARYTVGFSASVENGTAVEVLGKQAHAWVEVYVAGIGWVAVEVTGSSSSSNNEVIKMTLSPKDVRREYVEGTTVYATNELSSFNLSAYGYTYVATVSGSVTGLGTAKSNITELEIYDPSGNLVYCKTTGLGKEKFDIKYNSGTVQQYISMVKFQSGSESKIYDGVALETEVNDCSLLDGDVYAELGYTYVITPTGRIDSVGTTSSTFKVNFYKDGVDCTSHFWITSYYGTLAIGAKEITISAKSDEKTFDGKPLVCNVLDFDQTLLANGDSIESFVIVGQQTNIGSSSNVLKSIRIVNSLGKDVTGNYKITILDGVLTVKVPTK